MCTERIYLNVKIWVSHLDRCIKCQECWEYVIKNNEANYCYSPRANRLVCESTYHNLSSRRHAKHMSCDS